MEAFEPGVFRAQVQYNDMKGTAAADYSDYDGPRGWLREKGLIEDDEHIVGIEMGITENDGSHTDPIYVEFLLYTPDTPRSREAAEERTESGKLIPVKAVGVEMSLVEFFGLFKRFDVLISSKGMLTNLEVERKRD